MLCAHGSGEVIVNHWLSRENREHFDFGGGLLMSWDSSRRRSRFNKGWAKVRKAVLERDGHRCQWLVEDSDGFVRGRCGCPATAVDHKVRHADRDDDSMSNLWSLCDYHHNLKTQVESAEGKRSAAARRRVQRFYEHPAFR
jgi:5-methylcytosine-specific restriction endonuclease McrA